MTSKVHPETNNFTTPKRETVRLQGDFRKFPFLRGPKKGALPTLIGRRPLGGSRRAPGLPQSMDFPSFSRTSAKRQNRPLGGGPVFYCFLSGLLRPHVFSWIRDPRWWPGPLLGTFKKRSVFELPVPPAIAPPHRKTKNWRKTCVLHQSWDLRFWDSLEHDEITKKTDVLQAPHVFSNIFLTSRADFFHENI